MVDIVEPQTRSRMMSSIGRTDTAPELSVRRYLHAAGLRFRVHDRALPGKPDIVLARHRVVVFVNGCFWHRHLDCRFATMPASNMMFWRRKFERNVERDREITTALEASGWTVLVVWECETHDEEKLDHLYWRIRGFTLDNHEAAPPDRQMSESAVARGRPQRIAGTRPE